MNKIELVGKLVEKTGIDKKNAEKFINSFVETVTNALAEGDKIQLIGFGTFETRERASRDARNPQTGAAVRIAAKKVPAFKPGKALKDAINK